MRNPNSGWANGWRRKTFAIHSSSRQSIPWTGDLRVPRGRSSLTSWATLLRACICRSRTAWRSFVRIILILYVRCFYPSFLQPLPSLALHRQEKNLKQIPLLHPHQYRRWRNYLSKFYVHWWDYTTSVEEVMHGLNRLVLAGEVLYLGISDTPAWIVSKANQCKIF